MEFGKSDRLLVRVVYLIPVALIILALLAPDEGISFSELKMMIEEGGLAMLLMFGGFAGSAIAGFVSIFYE